MVDIKVDTRTLVTFGICVKCGQENRYGMNRFYPTGRDIPAYCPKCRDKTIHKTTYSVLDVRGLTILEQGYDATKILVQEEQRNEN